MQRYQQPTEVDEATPDEAATALRKSRQFLTQRLLPDLEQATQHHRSLEFQIEEYRKLRDTLRSLDTDTPSSQPSISNSPSASKVSTSNPSSSSSSTLADVGGGVAITTQLIREELPIISLGLANFYAQLTNREARAFITQKLVLLEKKKDLAIDKIAKIEAHIHLTSTSITQLDNLHRGGTIIDDL